MIFLAVVLPTYNGIKYIRESVESVLGQTYQDFEFLICDDHSTDGTWEYLQTLNDSRIRLFRNEQNKGLFPTLNFLIRQTSAQWIHLWSQDDIMYPFCLEAEADFARRHPDVPFFFSQRDIIDQTGKIISPYDENYDNELIPERHLIKISILAGSVTGNIANTVVKRNEIERVGYFDEKMRYSADFDLWERLSRGKDIGVINKALIQLREHSGQLSKQLDVKIFQLKENQLILRRWLERISDPKIKRKAIRGLRWKINVMFCLWGMKMIAKGKVKLAWQLFKEFSKYDNLFALWIRCAIVKILDIARLKQRFYNLLFYKGYYK